MPMAGIATSCLLMPQARYDRGFASTVTGIPSFPARRHSSRIRAEVSYVTSEEAKQLVNDEGYAVLDVRDQKQVERARIKPSFHIPLFIENKDNDIGTIIIRTLHNNFSGLFFGIPFTRPNPKFVESVKEEFNAESKLLIVCQEGLRSTAAARKLEEAGYGNLACILSGLQSCKSGTFATEGSRELKDAGKGGLVNIQAQISIVLGSILISALLFITLFPDQAEKILAAFSSN